MIQLDRSALRERVLGGMDLVGRRQAMQDLWGNQFDSLVDYLALTAAPAEVGLELLRHELTRRTVRRTMVLSGERCSGANPDGSDSPILLGMAKVAEILGPVSCLKSETRNGREPDALTLGFSGGMTLSPAMGEIECSVMAEQFNRLTDNRFQAAVQHDSFALNTGDQARLLAGLIFARRADLVVISHVLDHGPRFGANIAAAVSFMLKGRNYELDELVRAHSRGSEGYLKLDERGRQLVDENMTPHRPKMPEFLFVSHGDWTDLDPRRGKGEGISRAREAFGPPQEPHEVVYPGKSLGNEYHARYFGEQHPFRSLGYACPALSPDDMFKACIPSWLSEMYFAS